ncbi:MAG TPA: DUF2961 domain-containing protein, partial [Candidatus Hydrogenedentes bacterium]|nr:DUF2961 domain-containing protein [Candidatus Hydrogenedentota bacterium]
MMATRTLLSAIISTFLIVTFDTSADDATSPTDAMENLAFLKDYTVGRVSSYDRTGGNRDGLHDDQIQPGETRVLASLSGPGAITHIWTTNGSREPNHLRKLVLRMYWDDEEQPSVEAPLGDFFGLGHASYYMYASAPFQVGNSNGLNCFWHMPFAKNAKVTLTNDGTMPVRRFFYHIDFRQYAALPENLGRFHAQYRQAFPCASEDNYVVFEAKGRGHYVGCNLSVKVLEEGWWGEGDEMVYIDGETAPRLHGTGTEDYFGGAWCYGRPEPFSYLYFGCPLRGTSTPGGLWNVYRYHIVDPITFKESIRFTIEHGHANDRKDNWASVAYW